MMNKNKILVIRVNKNNKGLVWVDEQAAIINLSVLRTVYVCYSPVLPHIARANRFRKLSADQHTMLGRSLFTAFSWVYTIL